MLPLALMFLVCEVSTKVGVMELGPGVETKCFGSILLFGTITLMVMWVTVSWWYFQVSKCLARVTHQPIHALRSSRSTHLNRARAGYGTCI